MIIVFSTLIIGEGLISHYNTIDASSDNYLNKTVIIDAGHGGIDSGTSSADGTPEKEINLQISLKLDEILNSMGINTYLTRTDDNSIHDPSAETIRQKKVSDIKNRLSIMENTEDCIFVSIHQNHFSQTKYKGTQVFYSKNNPLSSKLADSIRLSIISNLQKDNSREIKAADSAIYLLHHAQKPAVMVECGFMSNPQETEDLKNETYQRKLAFLIALGITDYLKNSEEI